jgi:hypothetical protein
MQAAKVWQTDIKHLKMYSFSDHEINFVERDTYWCRNNLFPANSIYPHLNTSNPLILEYTSNPSPDFPFDHGNRPSDPLANSLYQRFQIS